MHVACKSKAVCRLAFDLCPYMDWTYSCALFRTDPHWSHENNKIYPKHKIGNWKSRRHCYLIHSLEIKTLEIVKGEKLETTKISDLIIEWY